MITTTTATEQPVYRNPNITATPATFLTMVPVQGYERYSICEEGFIRDHKRNVFMVGHKADVNKCKWYQLVHLTDSSGKPKLLLIHRLIAQSFIPNLANKPSIDHIDGNGLNNEISNLRWVTHKENQQNKKPKKNGSSKFMGVSWYKTSSKWTAQICINGKMKRLGYFIDELTAAKAYDVVALENGVLHHNGLIETRSKTDQLDNVVPLKQAKAGTQLSLF